MTSSIYAVPAPVNGAPITADTDILTSDLNVIGESLKPGGTGLLRVVFSLEFANSPAEVSVFGSNVFKGKFNADNLFNIFDNGYYRFDIDVREGDSINFRASENITTVNFFRVDLVLFGA